MDACKCQIITMKQIMNVTNWDQAKTKNYKNQHLLELYSFIPTYDFCRKTCERVWLTLSETVPWNQCLRYCLRDGILCLKCLRQLLPSDSVCAVFTWCISGGQITQPTTARDHSVQLKYLKMVQKQRCRQTPTQRCIIIQHQKKERRCFPSNRCRKVSACDFSWKVPTARRSAPLLSSPLRSSLLLWGSCLETGEVSEAAPAQSSAGRRWNPSAFGARGARRGGDSHLQSHSAWVASLQRGAAAPAASFHSHFSKVVTSRG